MSYNFVVQALLDYHLKNYEAAEAEGGQHEGHGKTAALFSMIMTCGEHGVPMPGWVVAELKKALEPWFSFKIGSLDEAFGVTTFTPTYLENMRRNAHIRRDLHRCIAQLKEERKSIDWDELATKYKKSKSTLQALYYNCPPTFPEKS